MVEMGVLDPTKVTRYALQNAASVAGADPHDRCDGRRAAEGRQARRCPAVVAWAAWVEEALEALDRNGRTLRLRHENGTLKRTDDEAREFLYIRIGRQLSRIDRCFQAIGHRSLVFRIYRGNASANCSAPFARLRRDFRRDILGACPLCEGPRAAHQSTRAIDEVAAAGRFAASR